MPIVKLRRETEKTSRVKVAFRDIHNDAELMQYLEEDLQKMIDNITKEMHASLMQYIELYVYSTNNEWYVPTFQFPLAWIVQKEKSGLGASVVFDPTNVMRWDRYWAHGSKITGWNSAVPYMSELLNTVGGTSHMGWNNRSVGYWDEFIKEWYEGGEIDRLFSASLAGLWP
jgi:hypothetical protein